MESTNFKGLIALVLIMTSVTFSSNSSAKELTGWKRITSEHVEFYTDYDDATAMELVEQFEVFRSTILQLLKGQDTTNLPPVQIIMLKSKSMWQQHRLSGSVGGYFQNRIYGPLMVVAPYEGKLTLDTLFHEYVHYLVASTVPIRYANWYNEGIAEFFSTMLIEDDFVYIGKIPEGRARELRGGLTRLDDLFAGTRLNEQNARYKSKFYATAWLTTHYFTLGARNGFPSHYASSAKFLQLKSEGVGVEEAFAQSFDLSMSDLYKEIRRYARSNKKEGIALDKPQLAGKPQLVKLSSTQVKSVLSPMFGWSDREGLGYQYLLDAAQGGDAFAQSILAIHSSTEGDMADALTRLALLEEKGTEEYSQNTLYNIGIVYRNLSGMASKQDDFDVAQQYRIKALAYLQQSVESGGYLPSLLELARYKRRFASKNEALDAINELLSFAPNHPASQVVAARNYIELGEYESATISLDAAQRLVNHDTSLAAQVLALKASLVLKSVAE